jgi:succinate dehydrogenase / fumarate reductase flavoprotein subunit
VKNLFVAGEAVGGIHGENRLMGNSLLDIIVFGRNAGWNASRACKNISTPKGLNIDHVGRFMKEAEDTGIKSNVVSPKLLPDYARIGR